KPEGGRESQTAPAKPGTGPEEAETSPGEGEPEGKHAEGPGGSGGAGSNGPGGGKGRIGIAQERALSGPAAPLAGFAQPGGGSSPLVPILVAVAVLAALSVGAVLYRQRRQIPVG
ncbi:MAG TPA: hypothetical protein VEB65_12265, partial [Solirubrobacterales bacterium]|nr:hypothetical protein [Solirubrobacterales bacterium]